MVFSSQFDLVMTDLADNLKNVIYDEKAGPNVIDPKGKVQIAIFTLSPGIECLPGTVNLKFKIGGKALKFNNQGSCIVPSIKKDGKLLNIKGFESLKQIDFIDDLELNNNSVLVIITGLTTSNTPIVDFEYGTTGDVKLADIEIEDASELKLTNGWSVNVGLTNDEKCKTQIKNSVKKSTATFCLMINVFNEPLPFIKKMFI